MKSTVFELITWLTCARLIAAQTLISTLQARPELVLFNSYIQSNPSLLNTLRNATNYTLLAPSDTAMTRWLNDSSPPPSQDRIDATLFYHILHGSYPLGSFSAIPQFASSYLSNVSFTNVTGGAAVQLVEGGGNPILVSALGESSSIANGNHIANGGLFHIIDTVMAIPQQELATATEAAMEYYLDIMTQGGYTTGKANDINNALEVESDMTFFVPNSVAALENFTSITAGWSTDRLDALLKYHAIPGIVVYSPSMRNGVVLPTVQGGDITIYVGENGTMYANNVKILVTDYLTSNGVMHTIDGVLNPYNITKPLFPSSSAKKKALPMEAIIGIAIGCAIVLLVALTAALWCRRRSKRKTAANLTKIKATDTRSARHPTQKAAFEVFDNSRRSDSKRSAAAKTTESSSRNHSKRSTTSTATKSSQGSRRSLPKKYISLEQVKYEKEKARVEVEVRRVVGEQLDAFRRSGYYDTSPAPSIAIPVVRVMSVRKAAELDAAFSIVGRHELSAGNYGMPVIEEMPTGEEEAGGLKPITRMSSRTVPAIDELPPGEEVELKAISRRSSGAMPVIEEGGEITLKSPISRASSRTFSVTVEGVKAVSRASSRAMILDRR